MKKNKIPLASSRAYHIQLPLPEVPLLKNYCPKMIKAIIKTIYNKLIKPGRRTPLTTITLFYSHQDHD